MLFRPTLVCHRVPSIVFTYAIAKSSGSASHSVREASAKFAAQKGARGPMERIIYESFDDLPANLRPHLLSELEMDTVMMGGAAPYVPKHLQKKKQK